MRKLSKALSLILAVVIAVSNLPPLEASAVTTAPINPQPQSTGMRLRQTGFDEETGILTMTLEVKPSLAGNVWVDSDGYSNYEGRFINEAYLAFQVDTLSVEPITTDGTVIDAGYGRIGFVGFSRERLDQYGEDDTFGNVALRKKFVNAREGMGIQYGQGFNKSMGTVRTTSDGQKADTFNELFSGYYTSNNREESGLMDCYLHLKWDTDVVDCNDEEVTGTDLEGNPLEPGYVKAIDLYFQCYSGDVDSNGERTKAHSVDALFCNSIRIPRDVDVDSSVASPEMTKEEIQELVDQFYVYREEYRGDTEQQYIAVGAAGICELERDPIWGTSKKSYDYYAYDIAPRVLDWQVGAARRNQAPIDTEPTLSYENKDKQFIVLQFDAQIENTYKFGDSYTNTDTADFFIPTDAGKGQFPRYEIPYMSEMDALESAEETNGMWMPKAHFFQEDKYVPLKYHLTTYVSASSTTKPEVEDGMDAFLHSVNWKFALRERDGEPVIPLDEYYKNNSLSYKDPLADPGTVPEETKTETVTLRSDAIEHTYEVRQAYINDRNSNYYGCKVQTVQETTPDLDGIDREVHVTPVGVMFDFSDRTEVTHLTMEQDDAGEFVKSPAEPGYAPQLRIASQAADTRSYLWLGTLGTGVATRRGSVYILAEYTDPAGGVYSVGREMQVQLYKDDERTPSYTELSLADQYRDPDQPENEKAYKIDAAQDGPTLAMAGIQIDARMYDQYGDNLYDAEGKLRVPNIEIVPTGTAKDTIDAGKGVNALNIRFDEEAGLYYLIYGNNQLYGANDLVPGEYEIRAVYDGVSEEEVGVCRLTVTKDPNKFSYLESDVRLTSDTIDTPQGLLYGEKTVEENGEEIHEVRLRVPPKVLNSEAVSSEQSVTASFNLVELANQWRDVSDESNQLDNDPAYDVLPDLRDPATGEWNISKLREYFSFSFEWNKEDGTRTPITGVSNLDLARTGRFTYTSAAGVGTHPATKEESAVEGDPMYVTVKVARVDGEPDEVLTNKYRIYFVRDTRTLTTIKGRYLTSTPGKDVTANLEVPDQGKTVKARVDFMPYDQYDEAMNFDALQKKDGMQWEMRIDADSMRNERGEKVKSLEGVSLVDLNSSYIQLTEKADPCTFDVYAVYGGKSTLDPKTNNNFRQAIHVKVTKKPSVPAKVVSMTEGIIAIDVPNIEQPDKVNKGGPKIVVEDQYGEVMDEKDYFMRWSFEQMPPDPRIHLDPATGKVSVESCAPAWDNIKMSVKLYSKVESPVGSGNWVQGPWMKDIKGTTTYEKLRVVRKTNPDVTELEITTESLEYPTQDAATRVAQVEAYATTEYGVRTKLTADDGSTWLLESVEYSDGTKASYREPILDPVTGEHLKDENGNLRWRTPNPKQVDFETNGNTYFDINRKVISELKQYGGQIRFGNSITNIDWAPVAITVTCKYSNATKTIRLPIKYEGKEFSAVERRPDTVRILDGVGEVIKVPKSTEPVVKRTLDAEVKDQFGFVIYGSGAANAPCKWEIMNPQKGVSIEGGNTLVVDSYAGNGSVTVKATYTQGEHSKSSEQAIGMGLEPSAPTVLTPLGIDELPEAADMEDAIIPMPGFTGPGEITREDGTVKQLNNAVPATYTLRSKVEDGNHVHLTTQTVKWTVTQDTYNMVSIANNNKMTVQCTQAWIDAGRPETVEVKLHAYDSSSAAVNADVTLTIQKQDAFGAYAMPELDPTAPPPIHTDNPGLESTHLLVPNMDDYEENGPNKVYFEAKVYSQYREELPQWPAEISYREPNTLAETIMGLKMTPTLNRKSTLEISPNVDVSVANVLIVAKPTGEKATLDTSVNKYDIHLDSGASYQAGVALGKDYFNPAGEKAEDVPAWDAGEDPNIPSEAVVYTEFELEAFVHDQRGSDYEGFNVDGVYPVWALGDDCPEGVTFENPTEDASRNNTFDADGNPYGKKVRIWVNNKVLGQNEQTRDISVKVWANGHKGEGGDFEKIQTVTLEKSTSRSAYIYFENVLGTDPEDGAGIGETLVRPGLNEPSVSVPIGSMVYDSYGYVKNDVPTTITINEAAFPEGVTVEPILQSAEETAAAERAAAEGPKAEEEPAKVIGQRVMRGDLVMAEFIPSADGLGDGVLTIFTPCNLEAIELQLQCDRVPGMKTLRLPISQQEKFAQSAVLYDDDTGVPVESAEVVFNRDTDEPILRHFYVAIFDQYGDRISGELARTITPVWKIMAPGEEEDTWLEYDEVDDEGNPLPAEERVLRYRDSAETKSLTMLVSPANYRSALKLKVECQLMKDGAPMSEIPVQEMALSVRKRSSNSNSSASGAYLVTYLGGAHGTLVGNIVTETVLEGTSPKLVPDVNAAAGYAHRGWEMDGEIINDPSKLQVYSDVVLVAQYIKLSDVAFVSGYKDNTVKPNADVTRGEFTRMLVGALTNYDPATHAKYANPFEDVGEERYYRDYIAYAYFYGIVSGYEDHTFRPEEPITRAEAAGMLAKAKNFEPAVGVVEFKDLDPERWYTGYVEALGRVEILHGYEDGTFRPANHLTRAEAVTMLVRTSEAAPSERELEAIRRTSKVPFKDLDRKYWAFPYILRAAGIA